jgi:hypothetical protein
VHDQFVDQERQRHLVHLLLEELVLEASGEGHQDVGRDRSGDGDAHTEVSSEGWVSCSWTTRRDYRRDNDDDFRMAGFDG